MFLIVLVNSAHFHLHIAEQAPYGAVFKVNFRSFRPRGHVMFGPLVMNQQTLVREHFLTNIAREIVSVVVVLTRLKVGVPLGLA